MNVVYQNTQTEFAIAVKQGEALLKALPALLRKMKQVETDLRVVEYDHHRGDGVSEREYMAIAKRYEELFDVLIKSRAKMRCKMLYDAFDHIEDTFNLMEDHFTLPDLGAPSRVARRYANRD